MAGFGLPPGRFGFTAPVHHSRTAVRKRAAHHRVGCVGHHALDRHPPPLASARDRHRVQQTLGIGVIGALENVPRRAVPDHFPRYMTAIWSHIWDTTPKLWVIRTIETSNSSHSRCMRSRICACTVTSSAVVSSSAIRICGLQDRARAMTSGCCAATRPRTSSKCYLSNSPATLPAEWLVWLAARRIHAQHRQKYCAYRFRQYEVSLHYLARQYRGLRSDPVAGSCRPPIPSVRPCAPEFW